MSNQTTPIVVSETTKQHLKAEIIRHDALQGHNRIKSDTSFWLQQDSFVASVVELIEGENK